jgi:membrane associated rhomboid family serine protease
MVLPLHDRNPKRHIRFAYVNYTLIVATVLIFLLEMALTPIGFRAATINFGFIPGVIDGTFLAPSTLLPAQANFVTYAFLHADWMHLLTNMLFLWIFGDNIEDALGHVRYALFYAACAALAAGAHYIPNAASPDTLIGASGAVAGVMGAYVLLFPRARLIVLATIIVPIPLPIPAFWMLGFWIATQAFYAFIGSTEPIAWWAHLGGALAGVVMALVLKRRDVPLFGGF